jgi:uncharacterized protein YajQ (UPF0234 family)
MEKHIYVQAILLEKDPQSGETVVRIITNQGRFILGNDIVDKDITGNFYSYIRDLGVKEVKKILASEVEVTQKLKDDLQKVAPKEQPSA